MDLVLGERNHKDKCSHIEIPPLNKAQDSVISYRLLQVNLYKCMCVYFIQLYICI